MHRSCGWRQEYDAPGTQSIPRLANCRRELAGESRDSSNTVAKIDSQMLPAAVCHQVTTPAVGKLVGNDINVLPVAADNGGCSKREDWVLHAWAAMSVGLD